MTVMRRASRTSPRSLLGASSDFFCGPSSWPSSAASKNIIRARRTATRLARQPVISGPFGPSAAPSPTPGPHRGRPGQPLLTARVVPGPPASGAGREPLEAHSPPNPAPLPITLARLACALCPPTRQPARSARDEPPSPLLSRPATSTGPVVTSTTTTRRDDDAQTVPHAPATRASRGGGSNFVSTRCRTLSKK